MKNHGIICLTKIGLLLIYLLFANSICSFSQVYNNWAFGHLAQVNVGGAAVSGPVSSMSTGEGCASISDGTGTLLFYTDGIKVWNAAGVSFAPALPLMNGSPNGASGSSTQGVVIVPVPGGPANEYFIYTVSDRNGNTNYGLTEYRVDVAASTILGGAVGIAPAQNYAMAEQITAIPHCNGVDYWVIVKPISNNTGLFPLVTNMGGTLITGDEIMAYLVTSAGIAGVAPVISIDPHYHINGAGSLTNPGTRTDDLVGTFKFSPNKEFFVVAERQSSVGLGTGFIHLFRFDCGSGTFSHINTITQNAYTYGVSFSPLSRRIYAQRGSNIAVYDLDELYANDCIPDSDKAIPLINTFLSGNSATNLTQLQIAPNGNIYVSKNGTNRMGEIISPDGIMVYNSLAVALTVGSSCLAGLPNNMDALDEEGLDFTYCSQCDNVCFELIGCDTLITWNFGDGIFVTGSLGENIPTFIVDTITLDTTYTNSTGTFNHPCHYYGAPGVYIATVTSEVDTLPVVYADTITIGGGASLSGPSTSCLPGCYTFTPMDGTYVVTIDTVYADPAGAAIITPDSADSNTYCLTFTSFTDSILLYMVYTDIFGCKDTVSMDIGPCCDSLQVIFDTIPDQCADITQLILSAGGFGYATPLGGVYTCPTCPPGTITHTGAGGSTTIFDPSIAGWGTWTVEYVYTSGDCSDTATQTVTVKPGIWNISTLNTNLTDIGSDIVTDSQGNVYVVGTYEKQTTFPGSSSVTIPPLPLTSSAGSAYIAKYDNCGELLWINYDSENFGGYTMGGAIAIDESNGAVFIAGPISRSAIFQSTPATPAIPVPTPAPIVITGFIPVCFYVAKFDLNTGAYLNMYYEPFPSGSTLHQVSGLDIDNTTAGTSELYYSANYQHSNTNFISRIGRIDNTGAIYTSTIWPVMSGFRWRETATNMFSAANDIAFNRIENRVYTTGRFRGTISFPGGPSASATSTMSDAFFNVFDANTGTSLLIRAGGTTSAEVGTGSGVDVDDATGSTYLTGSFSGNIAALFGYTGASYPLGSPAIQRGYIIKINYTSFVWRRPITAAGRDVKPTGVFVDATNVYLTGTFGGNITAPPAGPFGLYISTSALPKMFTYALNSSTSGYVWFNTATDAMTGAEHFPTRITASAGFTYSTGAYTRQLGYNIISGTGPVSGTLLSSPVTSKNTFIVRNELVTGFYKNGLVEDDPAMGTQSDMISADMNISINDIRIYPNPTTGEINIQLPAELLDHEINISVMDINGKMVFTSVTIASALYRVDLGSFENGMYFITVTNGQSTYHKKVIKN
jgi:hypothetical protein